MDRFRLGVMFQASSFVEVKMGFACFREVLAVNVSLLHSRCLSSVIWEAVTVAPALTHMHP